MRAIFKFPLKMEDRQIIRIPEGAVILSVQQQGRQFCLWALVDKTNPMIEREVRFFGTGQEITEHDLATSSYVGTVQNHGFVWHIFAENK